MGYLAIIPILAFLIIIHELGHFFAARSVGVKVEEFGIGLPPRAKGWKRNGVLWSLNWIPFGGFVRVKGEDAKDMEPGSMNVTGPFQRAWFLIAGPLMNLLAAIVISTILVATVGLPSTQSPLYIGAVNPSSPAEEAGWMPGDRIVAVNGTEMDSTQDVIDSINSQAGSEVTVTMQRGNEQYESTVTPRENPPEGQGATGISFGDGRLSTVRVNRVDTDSAAARAGLQEDDTIVAINGTEIESFNQAQGIMNGLAGEDATITIERNGESQDVTLTVPERSISVSDVDSGSAASDAGLFATDQITSINGEPVASGGGFIDALRANSSQTVELGYIRTTVDGPVDSMTNLRIPDLSDVTVEETLPAIGFSLLQPSGFLSSGISPIGIIDYEPVSASQWIPEGIKQFWNIITQTVTALQRLFTSGDALSQLAGPIGMGQVTGQVLDETGGNPLPMLLNITMLISISLGLFNLLPIPALDGGRLLFVIIEILRGGKRVPPEKEGAVHMVGMLILLGLMFVIAFGDVSRILNGDSIFP